MAVFQFEQVMQPVNMDVPAGLIEIAVFGTGHGIRGGLHVLPYSSDADALLANQIWWWRAAKQTAKSGAASRVIGADQPTDWQCLTVRSARPQGTGIVAQLVGVDDRNTADLYRGGIIGLPRSAFPALSEDEYYWVDLIGLRVVNLQGVLLGHVVGMQEHTAHALLQVERSGVADGLVGQSKSGQEPKKVLPELIPFVARHIAQVDLAAGYIQVDWEW